MSTQTKIEWCDSTFNPWIGCTKVSPACDNCYAEADFDLRRHRVKWGAGQARSRTSAENWHLPVKWNKQQFVQCPNCGWRGDWKLADARNGCCPACNHLPELFIQARRRVFCASLADWLDNEVSIEWLCDLLDLIRRCENLDFLLLTKRIGNWRSRLAEALSAEIRQNRRAGVMIGDWLNGSPPANVWIGATVCNQAEADRDIPKLLAVPAAKRFLSMEPLLGPVDLERPRPGPDLCQGGGGMICQPWLIQSGIDWVIVGGESGPNARPMHPYWVRGIRDQCAAAGVPFLFKQWGEWAPAHDDEIPTRFGDACESFRTMCSNGFVGKLSLESAFLHKPRSWPQCFPEGEEGESSCSSAFMRRVGKKAAGRLLDGRTWEQFP